MKFEDLFTGWFTNLCYINWCTNYNAITRQKLYSNFITEFIKADSGQTALMSHFSKHLLLVLKTTSIYQLLAERVLRSRLYTITDDISFNTFRRKLSELFVVAVYSVMSSSAAPARPYIEREVSFHRWLSFHSSRLKFYYYNFLVDVIVDVIILILLRSVHSPVLP